MFKVVVTESAERDYREILEYLADVLRNPQYVIRFFHHLQDYISKL